jgi:hypothetical protein
MTSLDTLGRAFAGPNRYCWVFTFEDEKVVDIVKYRDTALIERVLGTLDRTPAVMPRPAASASAGGGGHQHR